MKVTLKVNTMAASNIKVATPAATAQPIISKSEAQKTESADKTSIAKPLKPEAGRAPAEGKAVVFGKEGRELRHVLSHT